MIHLGRNSVNLFLIRHAESVDNVAGLYGGVSDAELTNHGILQTTRLARHLQTKHGRFTHVFSSDLQRARRTGEAIVDHQNSLLADREVVEPSDICSLQILPVLREQDFGSLERQPFSAMARANLQARKKGDGWVAPETKASMDERADAFLNEHIWPLLVAERPGEAAEESTDVDETDGGPTVAVVSHGMLLSRLWKRLLARCPDWSQDVVLRVEAGPRGLEHLGSWSNTGHLHLLLIPRSSKHTDAENAGTSPNPRNAEAGDKADDKDNKKGNDKKKDDESNGTSDVKRVNANNAGKQEHSNGKVKSPTTSVSVPSFLVIVNDVNVTEHLKSLKRTRGGIGSAAHDGSQRSIDSFFKKRKIA